MTLEKRYYSNGKTTIVCMFHYFDNDTNLLISDIFFEFEIGVIYDRI
jgi:hypothetical protein